MLKESECLLRKVVTSQLEIAYYEAGPKDGWTCILNHGFPYDVLCFKECIKPLVEAGAYVIVPFLRGYGPTRFLSDDTLRSGQQAALANDLLELMDALKVRSAVLAGYDWGGRASCIVAALWPERVSALVSGNSYNLQNIPRSMEPEPAKTEANLWYQYYFHSERGLTGLRLNRCEIAKLLWQMWSPTWQFSQSEFDATATSFNNPDFVDVVIHSYRHRFGLVAGDHSVAQIEVKLEKQPNISVPTITVDGGANGLIDSTAHHADKFSGPHEHRVFDNAGHNLPQEKPLDWVKAILDAQKLT